MKEIEFTDPLWLRKVVNFFNVIIFHNFILLSVDALAKIVSSLFNAIDVI